MRCECVAAFNRPLSEDDHSSAERALFRFVNLGCRGVFWRRDSGPLSCRTASTDRAREASGGVIRGTVPVGDNTTGHVPRTLHGKRADRSNRGWHCVLPTAGKDALGL